MAKMTIYVPDDLKGRMDAAEGVNWSPLACRAFEAKLAEIITIRGAKDMKDVIVRLRASSAKSDSVARSAGIDIGRESAKIPAEASELRTLAKADQDLHGDWGDVLDPTGSAYASSETLFFVISPDDDGDRVKADGFWGRVHGRHVDGPSLGDPAYLTGFIEGALEVWTDVEKEI